MQALSIVEHLDELEDRCAGLLSCLELSVMAAIPPPAHVDIVELFFTDLAPYLHGHQSSNSSAPALRD
jgi:hypothetical protein